MSAGARRGRVDEEIAASHADFLAHPVFHDLADHGAFGMPGRRGQRRGEEFLNAEEVELLAEDAMVALGGFFESREVRVKIFLREERGAVDALELGDFSRSPSQ